MSLFLNPIYIISILIALSVHEAAHAFMAERLGDSTARDNGRLTLNPLAHLDPLGTLLFVLIGFGWGKPVPINPHAFRHPKRDTALVALAGPFSNFLLALISFAGLSLLAPHISFASGWDLLNGVESGSVGLRFASKLLGSSLFLNLALMAFNILPLAPLDGSNILRAFVPFQYEEQYYRLMRIGPFILLALLLAGPLFGRDLLSSWIEWWVNGSLSMMQRLVGG